MVLYLTDADVRSLLDVRESNEIIEELFRQEALGKVENRPTTELRLPRGVFRLKAGVTANLGTFGYKAYPFGGRYLVFVYDMEAGLEGIVESRGLTEVRTGAVSAVALKYMTRPGATTMGIIGTGREARAQMASILAIRPFEKVWAFSRGAENRERFALEISEVYGIEVVAVESGEACVRDADVVTTITSANEPVLLGEWLRPGTHINAVGATSMNRRELDEEAVGRATTVIVEHLPQAEAELGELHYAAKLGRFSWDNVRELKDVVGGATPGRRGEDEITLFDSIGVGAEDVAMATYALRKARERGIGIELPFEPPYVAQRGAG